ncbi:MAG: hypothetical protein IJ327_02230 [Lachnospiraceae bacterium]|nr:hypothetical protein [Lachnospiraceae bacterium]
MTVDKLRNMNVKIRGYAMPDDNAPCFYKRSKLSEAMEIMRDYMEDFPEEFYNFAFNITDEEDEFLFTICREFDKVYLGRVNKYDLTTDIVFAALGMEVPGER